MKTRRDLMKLKSTQSCFFFYLRKKIQESVKAGVSDTLSHDGQMSPIPYNKWRTKSDEKAEGSVKSAFLVLITFLILRLLILIREAHYSGWLMNAMNQHKHCGLKSSQIILTNSVNVLRVLRGFNKVHDRPSFCQKTSKTLYKHKSWLVEMTDVVSPLMFNQLGWMHCK